MNSNVMQPHLTRLPHQSHFFSYPVVLSMTDWIKLYNEGEQSEAQPSQTQNVRNMKPYKHLLPGNLRQIQPKPSS